tara:strand:- start:5423 stop:6463 length:1041 start_codon:yes stop_codon:yes gene_type:complete
MISEITCTSCGAPVKIKINSSQANCNFCGLDINIVTEVFDQEIGFNGNRVDYSEFQNILELLKISKSSEDFTSVFQYCEKLIQLDSKNDKLWELIAQSHFLSIDGAFGEKEFTKFKTYLKGYQRLNKETTSITFVKLTENIYNIYFSKYERLSFDKSKSGQVWDSFSNESINFIIEFFEISELYYRHILELKILKKIVLELSGHKKDFWLISENGKISNRSDLIGFKFDALHKRQETIRIINAKEVKYSAPEIMYRNNLTASSENGNCFIATLCYDDLNHTNLVLLRNFRDKFLLNNNFGKFLVNTYYEISPKFIVLLNKKSIFTTVIKKLIIEPFVSIISGLKLH